MEDQGLCKEEQSVVGQNEAVVKGGSSTKRIRPRVAGNKRSRENESTAASLPDRADDDDDDDVVLEKENSAWDVMGERFQQAAAEGRYLDLSFTGQQAEKQKLGVSDAAAAFAALPKPVDPTTIVQPSLVTNKKQLHHEDDPLLAELGTLVNELVTKLKATRERLLGTHATTNLFQDVTEINHLTGLLQHFVDENSDAVMNSAVAIRRIETMNLLVCKANTLITAYNNTKARQQHDVVSQSNQTYFNYDNLCSMVQERSTTRNQRKGAEEEETNKRYPTRSRGKNQRNNEVIVIDD